MKYAPLATAIGTGVVEDLFATATKATLSVKGSYVPRLLFDGGLVAVALVGVQTGVIPRNVGTAVHVSGAALLGRNLAFVIGGQTKL